MRQMLKELKTRLTAGENLVMVTVIASFGATPRGAGARMLVGKSGRLCQGENFRLSGGKIVEKHIARAAARPPQSVRR